MRRLSLLQVLLVVYSGACVGGWAYASKPVIAFGQQCTAEQALQTFGGQCPKRSDDSVCGQNAVSCGSNSCVGDPDNPYESCIDSCVADGKEQAEDWCVSHWESGEFDSYDACVSILTNYYSANCPTTCFHEPNEWRKVCDVQTNESIVRTLGDEWKGIIYVETARILMTGSGYCTWRCICSPICVSNDGGESFFCVDDDTCWNANHVEYASTETVNFCMPGE